MNRKKELAKDIYDDFKLKITLWPSRFFIQKFRVLKRVKRLVIQSQDRHFITFNFRGLQFHTWDKYSCL